MQIPDEVLKWLSLQYRQLVALWRWSFVQVLHYIRLHYNIAHLFIVVHFYSTYINCIILNYYLLYCILLYFMYIGSKNQRYELKNYICIAKTLEAMESRNSAYMT